MDKLELEAYMRENIPLARAMDVRFDELTPLSAQLSAPLEPNLNHHGTGFGGSLASLALLAGWAALRAAAHEAGINPLFVVRRYGFEFLAPARGELVANARVPEGWPEFVRAFSTGAGGRLEVNCELTSDGRQVGRCTALYVGLAREEV